MEEQLKIPPNNRAQVIRVEIQQKSTHTKKRKVKTWSPEEDDELIKLHDQYPKKWGLIASLMQERNENQCLHRYRRLSQLGAHKKIWSAQEDQTIVSLIKKVGKNWKLLGEIIGTKTGKQIRERFINKLDPKIKTEEWTDEEDRLILKYYSEVGSKWSEISKKLTGRPENKIKNRFYSYIQKNYDIKYIYQNADSKIVSRESPNNVSITGCGFKIEDRKDELFLKEISMNERQPTLLKQYPKLTEQKILKINENMMQENIFEEDDIEEKASKVKIEEKPMFRNAKPNVIQEQIVLPSIKEINDFKISPELEQLQSRLEIAHLQEKDELFDSNFSLGQKFYIKSLIRVEDELCPLDSRFRSIKDLVSNEVENTENDLFYLSHN